MRDASFASCVAQALLAFYLAFVLWRGASTPSRRLLARMLFEVGLYAGLLAIVYVAGPPTPQQVATVAVAFGELVTLDLLAFGVWQARGAPDDRAPALPRVLWGAVVAALVVLIVLSLRMGENLTPIVFGLDPEDCEELLLFVTLLAGVASFAVAVRRREKGARQYLFAIAWLLTPLLMKFMILAGLPLTVAGYQLGRDLGVLAFEISVLTSYLDHGHEPMSLRDRIVAGVLAAVAMMVTAIAHLLLPLEPAVAASAPFGEVHRGALRLAVTLGVGGLAVAWLAPRFFRRSVLAPTSRLIDGLARAERGERVELPVEHQDELGRVTLSFNRMVAALDDGRARLAEKVAELEAGQAEIVALNEELRRQIVARSRQLADALRDVRGVAEPIGPGVLVDDRYLVEKTIGQGGMGRVYAARRADDGRSVALKVISGGSPEAAVRFMREAEIAAKVSHENLVPVYDVGLYAGVPYFVMERLVGGSLADASARFGDLGFVLPILAQVVRGVAALHARGVLHRDLKPANVLLAGDAGRPIAKIGDFGIAGEGLVDELGATVAPTSPAASQTNGVVTGTLPYMAPELARGREHFGRASDVFALGVLAWEVIGRGVPYRVPAIVLAMAGEAIPAPPVDTLAAPSAVASAIARAVSVDPELRPSLAELLAAIEGELEGASDPASLAG